MPALLTRTMNPARLNGVANSMDVRPWLGGGDAPVDLAETIANPANFALDGEGGGFLFIKLEAGLYEAHSLFEKTADAIAGARAALFYMFTETDCVEVRTRVPLENKAAIGLARALGFDKAFVCEMGWDGRCDLTVYTLTLTRWTDRAVELPALGEAFHSALETFGIKPNHGTDAAHDRAAGLAYAMGLAGNGVKGVWTYNRWARMASYQPLSVVSERPFVVDIHDAVLGFGADGMEVLKCR